jgi:hypothetical protein
LNSRKATAFWQTVPGEIPANQTTSKNCSPRRKKQKPLAQFRTVQYFLVPNTMRRIMLQRQTVSAAQHIGQVAEKIQRSHRKDYED